MPGNGKTDRSRRDEGPRWAEPVSAAHGIEFGGVGGGGKTLRPAVDD